MADRFPLIVDSSNFRIKELPAGDNLDLTDSKLVNTGNIEMAANTVASVYTSTVFSSNLGILNGNTALNISAFNYFYGTANANLMFSFEGVHSGNVVDVFVLSLTDGGSYTIEWPGSVRWPGNTAPTLSTTNTDVFVFITDNNGSTFRASYQQNYV